MDQSNVGNERVAVYEVCNNNLTEQTFKHNLLGYQDIDDLQTESVAFDHLARFDDSKKVSVFTTSERSRKLRRFDITWNKPSKCP